LVGLRDARIACRVALLLPCSVLHGQAEETLALGLTSCIYSGVEAPLQERTDIICALTLCDIQASRRYRKSQQKRSLITMHFRKSWAGSRDAENYVQYDLVYLFARRRQGKPGQGSP